MRAFAQLFAALDGTTRASQKLEALEGYFRTAAAEDAAWALWFLLGNRLKRTVKFAHLRLWAGEVAGLPPWLVEECYEVVGDLGETLALLLPPPERVTSLSLAQLVGERLRPLAGAPEGRQREILRATWAELDLAQRFLWHKLITGNFRVGVSRALLVRALAPVAGVGPPVMEHRLMGEWAPSAAWFLRLLSGEGAEDAPARPYPFFLASPVEGDAGGLGDARDWQCEWKWDGIRAQLIRRAGGCVLWSRGEEIVTGAFPEVAEAARVLPEGTVVDGELLAWRGDAPLPFAQLQRRLNRRSAGDAIRRAVPVVLMAYDLLELGGEDCRDRPLLERRMRLEQLLARATSAIPSPDPRGAAPVQMDLFGQPGEDPGASVVLRLSGVLPASSWEEVGAWRARVRECGAEGLMLKRRDSAYGVGRQRGAWWKWKIAPFTCDAVLVAAQPGHGRRAALFTDYTFALWRGTELLPVAKAYSGLTDAEMGEVDAFVRGNTTGRFGPVRSVSPELVFELAFEGVAPSPRHKSGLALRFPRIARWRRDKKPAEADTLEALRQLAAPGGDG